ncbi:response regulator [Acidovorax sp. sif1233]|uniref:response regulator n=1 Tax=unclassified Acidovorax TaxID=2684926 RepID=UPI001C4935B9|nr:response regulator [Acidovorax sp. sif1233]MBV7454156.1 response regulator [Acidovorax sp. sif1233]
MPLNTILVEDSKTIQETLVPALEELADARVLAIAETASDATEAVAHWREDWQLMVVDLFLREGSGIEVLQALQRGDRLRATPGARQGRPGQHVYVLSNYATADMRRRCEELGADGVFDKSTELDAFFERCSELPRRAGTGSSAAADRR